jgi:hypothetical protein
MNIQIQEIAESAFHSIEEVSEDVQNKIKEGKCMNCNGGVSGVRINYVLASNGKVLWWCDCRCIAIDNLLE